MEGNKNIILLIVMFLLLGVVASTFYYLVYFEDNKEIGEDIGFESGTGCEGECEEGSAYHDLVCDLRENTNKENLEEKWNLVSNNKEKLDRKWRTDDSRTKLLLLFVLEASYKKNKADKSLPKIKELVNSDKDLSEEAKDYIMFQVDFFEKNGYPVTDLLSRIAFHGLDNECSDYSSELSDVCFDTLVFSMKTDEDKKLLKNYCDNYCDNVSRISKKISSEGRFNYSDLSPVGKKLHENNPYSLISALVYEPLENKDELNRLSQEACESLGAGLKKLSNTKCPDGVEEFILYLDALRPYYKCD